MNKDIEQKWIKAGQIAAQARDHGAKLVKDGARVFDIGEAVENKIKQLGGSIAFPVNISINEMSAHYTPIFNDKTIINAEDYVKVDVGAHVDGYIGDTAITVRPSGKDDLILCSEKMLENALKIVKPGVRVAEIGQVIEETAKKFGFNPVRNLTGHSLEQYNLHAGLTIPNIETFTRQKLEENQVIAIEPFCTSGAGHVKDSGQAQIFMWLSDKSVRLAEARKILDMGRIEFKRLPFTKRWIAGISPLKIDMALKQLASINAVHQFMPLKEISNKPVAQTEHTIIVRDKPIITTKI